MMYCPACSGELSTLYGTGRYASIACANATCPDPSMAARILEDNEIGHIVNYRPNGFTLRHPLRERINDELMHCILHETLSMYNGPPAPLTVGKYRIPKGYTAVETWAWERLEAPGLENEPEK